MRAWLSMREFLQVQAVFLHIRLYAGDAFLVLRQLQHHLAEGSAADILRTRVHNVDGLPAGQHHIGNNGVKA